MPASSNLTLLVTVRGGDDEVRAVYKPGAGEEPLGDFRGPLFRREVAAYELSVAMGLAVVPETVMRSEAPLGEGSLQVFVEADFSEHYFSLLEQPRYADSLREIAGFDLVANNADRKSGHVLLDADGHLWGIDNGLCFHRSPKLRTVMWDFVGEPLPEPVLLGCEALVRAVPPTLADLLAPAELAALLDRCASLLDGPRFPEPDPARRAYPWPLV